MPDENPQLSVGSLVWVWADPGRWLTGTVVEVAEPTVTVRLSNRHNPEQIDIERQFLLPRDFQRHGADRPRKKPV
jgi:hypothetical protein